MESHFSGAQRLEGRRRRRLAVDSDGPASPDGAGVTNYDGQASGRDASGDRVAPASKSIPWQRHGAIPLIPRSLWKHFSIATLVLAFGAAILSIATLAVREPSGLSASVERLLSPESGTLHRAFPGLMLLVAGQVALIIRWYRSRSVHDYNGRYHVWMKAGVAWFVLSACVVTDAHLAWGDACSQWIPLKISHVETWAWLAPAALVAVLGWLPLYREMQGSRLSISCYLMCGALYLVAAALRLQWLSLATPELNWVTLHSITWLAHLLLLLSMGLHARYVIYFSVEPPESGAIGKRRRDWGRLDWLRPSNWFLRAAKEAAEGSSGKKGKSRRKPQRTKAAARTDSKIDETETPEQDETDLQTLEALTAPTAPPSPSGKPSPSSTAASVKSSAESASSGRVSIPRPGVTAPATTTPAPAAKSDQSDVSADRFRSTENDDEEDDSDDDDDPSSDQGDLRGLSKKQRRKLLRDQQSRRR